MKKITIIFIIVNCLLLFIGISGVSEESLPVLDGDFWNTITKLENSVLIKEMYIRGIKDGIEGSIRRFTIVKIPNILDPDDYEASLLHLNFLFTISENSKTVIDVMDNLYKNPANKDIPLVSMCEIAALSLVLENEEEKCMEYIESLLEAAREEALQEEVWDFPPPSVPDQ